MHTPDTVRRRRGRHPEMLTRATTDPPPGTLPALPALPALPSLPALPALPARPILPGRSATAATLSTGCPGAGAGRQAGPGTLKLSVRVKTGRRLAGPAPARPGPARPAPVPPALTPADSVSDGCFSDSDSDSDSDEGTLPGSPGDRRTATAHILDTCKRVYSRNCKLLNIIPRQHFLKQLGKRTLSMRNENLDRKELNAICASLVNLEKPFSLDLTGNRLSPRCVHYVCQLLSRNRHLTDLTLADSELGMEGLQVLVDLLPAFPTLRALDLSGNKLRDDSGRLLARLVSRAPGLSWLRLSHNELSEDGGVYLGEALGRNGSLQVLDLSWNHLRGRGAESVALALQTNTTLTHMDVSWNGFGFEGCCALGCALHNNTSLLDLNLTCNRVHPPALYELLKGVLCNQVLACLRLGRNPLPAAIMSAVLSQFREARQRALHTLDFTGVVVDKLFEVVLEEIQETRPNFQCFYERCLPTHAQSFDDNTHQSVLNIDPLRILFYIKKNLRIIDLFRQMDINHSLSVSREEVRRALQKEQLPMSSSGLDTIMNYLDVNNDGQIDLIFPADSFLARYTQELMEGERRYKREVITQKQQWQMESRAALPEQAPRFSRSYRPDLAQLDGGHGRKRGFVAPPDGKRESLAPPDGHGGRRDSLAPPDGHGGKRDSLAPPDGQGGKQESLAPLDNGRRTASVSLSRDAVKLPRIGAKERKMSAGSARDQQDSN